MAKTSSAPVGNLSVYYYSLQGADSKKRYKRKITLFEGQDPYVMVNNQPDHFPDFRYLIVSEFVSYISYHGINSLLTAGGGEFQHTARDMYRDDRQCSYLCSERM